MLPNNSGRIVFDSNRSGTFGIYSMNLDGSGIRAIVDSRQDEINPSVSLTGRVAYLRVERAGRDVPGEVLVVNADGSQAEKIGEGATHVAIAPKGDKVYFVANFKQIYEFDLRSKTKERIFPRKKLPGHFRPQRPLAYLNVSHSGDKLAFISYLGRGWRSVSLDLREPRVKVYMQGCQPFWTPGEDALIYMSGHSDGPDERRIMKYHLDDKSVEVVQDRRPPWGYEYFPSLSVDGKLLLFSESRFDQRDFYSSNFQIFTKDLNTNKVRRVSNDSYTNRYPRYLPSRAEAIKKLKG